jgi:RNA polymerase sigma factor (TIGR02999 family)
MAHDIDDESNDDDQRHRVNNASEAGDRMNAKPGTNTGSVERNACLPNTLCPESSIPADSGPQITQLVNRFRHGDREAEDQMLQSVYKDLHHLANSYMLRERNGNVLQPTALVNETYLRLRARDRAWQSRKHFYATAAQLMRWILADIRRRDKRHRANTAPENLSSHARQDIPDIVAIHRALTRLCREHPLVAETVRLKYFEELTNREIAERLDIGESTVEKYLRSAKAWLKSILQS